MLSRREIMKDGLLLSAVSSLAPALATARPMRARVWVVEEGLPASATVAAASSGSEMLAFTADPGPVWMNRLEPRLKTGPFPIGGYTSASVLFCLHYLARDYGLSLASLGEGMSLTGTAGSSPDAPVDLRDPRFGDQRAAHTWIMLPRRD